MTNPPLSTSTDSSGDSPVAGSLTPDAATGELLAAARAWRDDDPDTATRAELDALITAVEAGGDMGEASRADLADRFAGMLEFGRRRVV